MQIYKLNQIISKKNDFFCDCRIGKELEVVVEKDAEMKAGPVVKSLDQCVTLRITSSMQSSTVALFPYDAPRDGASLTYLFSLPEGVNKVTLHAISSLWMILRSNADG